MVAFHLPIIEPQKLDCDNWQALLPVKRALLGRKRNSVIQLEGTLSGGLDPPGIRRLARSNPSAQGRRAACSPKLVDRLASRTKDKQHGPPAASLSWR